MLTLSDACYLLRIPAPADAFHGHEVREPGECGDDSELAILEEAAELIGWELAEDERGALSLSSPE